MANPSGCTSYNTQPVSRVEVMTPVVPGVGVSVGRGMGVGVSVGIGVGVGVLVGVEVGVGVEVDVGVGVDVGVRVGVGVLVGVGVGVANKFRIVPHPVVSDTARARIRAMGYSFGGLMVVLLTSHLSIGISVNRHASGLHGSNP